MIRTIRFTVLVLFFLSLIFFGSWVWQGISVPTKSSADQKEIKSNEHGTHSPLNQDKQVNQNKQEKHPTRTRKPLPSADSIAKLPKDGGKEFNRLIFEKSPYLLQHARNPVDWYPWGKEAFEKAKKEGKPIFLSIGYSTCHWCHVMEHESFENQEIADLLNKHFVCVKLDREERPDIDNIYMTACQAMNGNGGWPLNALLTADKKPFFVGTYFPPTSARGRIGMKEFVPRIAELWKARKKDILEDADRLTKMLKSMNDNTKGEAISKTVLDKAYEQLSARFDEEEGGFSKSPKFPTPHTLCFLMRYYHRTGKQKALDMVKLTLTKMSLGGIYDHVGFGFHRYSTDKRWLLPHFEKMLYDQATLAIAFTEGYQLTKDPNYKKAALETIRYVQRDMTSSEGAFFSAEDADSEGVEGKFYLWQAKELQEVLNEKEYSLFAKAFEIKKEGNFFSPHCPPGTNIPHLKDVARKFAKKMKLSSSDWENQWQTIRKKLFEARKKRVHPYKDDKVLTDWNGLMIAAMAKAGRVFEDRSSIELSKRAADFLLSKMKTADGRLVKRYRAGSAGLPAHLEDYAFTVWGLLELYESTFDLKYLKAAKDLNQKMLTLFWDSKKGGLFFTASDGEKLLVRAKESYDGAIPSGNSVAMGNLIRLARITGDSSMEEKAVQIGEFFSIQINAAPAGHCQMLCNADFLLGPSVEVVLATPEAVDAAAEASFLKELRGRFIPNKVVVRNERNGSNPDFSKLVPFASKQGTVNGKVTAYVCRDRSCKAPTNNIQEMMNSILEGTKEKLPEPK